MGKTIFISYSHKDRRVVNITKKSLRSLGYNILIDYEAQLKEKNLTADIKSMIRQADIFLLVESGNASESFWIDKEIGYAEGLFWMPPVMFPIRIDDSNHIRKADWYVRDVSDCLKRKGNLTELLESKLNPVLKQLNSRRWRRIFILISILLSIAIGLVLSWYKWYYQPIPEPSKEITILIAPFENDELCDFSEELKTYIETSTKYTNSWNHPRIFKLKPLRSKEKSDVVKEAKRLNCDLLISGRVEKEGDGYRVDIWHRYFGSPEEHMYIDHTSSSSFSSIAELHDNADSINARIDYLFMFQMGQFHLEHKELDKARSFFSRLQDKFPNDPNVNIYLGITHQNLQDLAEAIKSYKRTLRGRPCFGQINALIYLLGNCSRSSISPEHPSVLTMSFPSDTSASPLLWLRKPKCKKLLDSMRSKYTTFIYRAQGKMKYKYIANFYLGLYYNLDSAEKYLKMALNRKTQITHAETTLGYLLLRKYDRPDSALKYFHRSAERLPKLWNSHINIAKAFAAYDSVYFLDSAIQRCKRARRLKPNEIAIHSYLAFLNKKRSNFTSVVRNYRSALDLAQGETKGKIWHKLGNAYFSLGRYDSAGISYKKSIPLLKENKPWLAEAHFDIARVEKMSGSCANATAHWRLAIALRPALISRDTFEIEPGIPAPSDCN